MKIGHVACLMAGLAICLTAASQDASSAPADAASAPATRPAPPPHEMTITINANSTLLMDGNTVTLKAAHEALEAMAEQLNNHNTRWTGRTRNDGDCHLPDERTMDDVAAIGSTEVISLNVSLPEPTRCPWKWYYEVHRRLLLIPHTIVHTDAPRFSPMRNIGFAGMWKRVSDTVKSAADVERLLPQLQGRGEIQIAVGEDLPVAKATEMLAPFKATTIRFQASVKSGTDAVISVWHSNAPWLLVVDPGGNEESLRRAANETITIVAEFVDVQQFQIITIVDGKVREMDSNGPLNATHESKEQAIKFVEAFRLAKEIDLRPAIARAHKMIAERGKDEAGRICLITPRAEAITWDTVYQITQLSENNMIPVYINILTKETDSPPLKAMLKTIDALTGGTHRFRDDSQATSRTAAIAASSPAK